MRGGARPDRSAIFIGCEVSAQAACTGAISAGLRLVWHEREEIGSGYRTIHLARPGRHLILYRVEGTAVLIVRILHDSMELSRHVPKE
ncbi:MAG: type II toxin-antitoxin system RelE/ParE family toxin [Hyphomonadaceae bacterium]